MMEILHRGSESVGVEAEMRNNISRFFVVCHENLIPRKDCPSPSPLPPSLLFPHPLLDINIFRLVATSVL